MIVLGLRIGFHVEVLGVPVGQSDRKILGHHGLHDVHSYEGRAADIFRSHPRKVGVHAAVYEIQGNSGGNVVQVHPPRRTRREYENAGPHVPVPYVRIAHPVYYLAARRRAAARPGLLYRSSSIRIRLIS